MANGSSGFKRSWRKFVDALKRAMVSKETSAIPRDGQHLIPWYERTAKALSGERFVNEITDAWRDLYRAERSRVAAELHHQEIVSVTRLLGEPGPHSGQAKSGERAGGAIKAGGVILGSMSELLDKALPDWAKAILIIGKEATEIASRRP
jgi:hypothetical protein